MPAPYRHSASSSLWGTPGERGHVRQRSSRQLATSTRLQFDDKTGEIGLPSLNGHTGRETNSLGLFDTKLTAPRKSKTSAGVYAFSPSRRSFGIPKRWRSAALLLATAVLVYLTLLTSFPGSISASKSKVDNSAEAYASARVRLLNRIHASRHLPKRSCEPFTAFGTLQVDLDDPDKNVWRSAHQECEPPSFFARLRAASMGGKQRLQARGLPTASQEDWSWFENKTVLLLGDSVSREHVENFCQLMGEQAEVVRPGHRLARSSPSAAGTDKPMRDVEAKRRLKSMKDGGALPRVCYIPKHDFMLASVMLYGLDQTEYWRNAKLPHYEAPARLEDRLGEVVVPLVQAMRRDGRFTAPDMIEVAAGHWDLARWGQEDVNAGLDPEAALDEVRLNWYRTRVRSALSSIRSVFPQTSVKVWRTAHYPTDPTEEYDYFRGTIHRIDQAQDHPKQHPNLFSHGRIAQIDSLVRSLIPPPRSHASSPAAADATNKDFRLNEWGNMLKGYNAHQKDRMHGEPLPGGYVWADTMLYELWRGLGNAASGTVL